MSVKLAPVAVFAFRRSDHLHRTLTKLAECKGAEKTDVEIFIDGAKTEDHVKDVSDTISVARCAYSFKSCTVHTREKNVGLKRNIIEGISAVLSKHDQVIVLEDDILCHDDFLVYMNKFLLVYKETKNVWHINGWNYNCNFKSNEDYYLSRIMNCWGWATWKNRWEKLELDPEAACHSLSFHERRRFNYNWTFPFFSQLLGNAIGINNTWAILWYYTIFKHKGLCVSPRYSLTCNIGSDGSGSHTALYDDMPLSDNMRELDWSVAKINSPIHESQTHREELMSHFCKIFSLARRAMGITKTLLPFKLSKFLFGKK